MPIVTGEQARARVLNGIKRAASVMSPTYGPEGGTILIERHAGLLATKDGATVVREVSLSDPLEQMGVRLLQQACINVENIAGDGTTTTAIITSALCSGAIRMVSAGESPIDLARELRAVVPFVCEVLTSMASEVNAQGEIFDVAMVASNQDEEISRLLSEAVMGVGRDGMVLVEGGSGMESSLDYCDGVLLSTGFVSAYQSKEWRRDRCAVVISALPLVVIPQVLPLYEEALKNGFSNVLLIAPYIEGPAKTTLSSGKGPLDICGIKAPGGPVHRRGILDDLAALTGATVIDAELGMDPFTPSFSWVGSLSEVKVRANNSLLIADEKNRPLIMKRISVLKGELLRSSLSSETDGLKKRIASLSGGLCILRVGGVTEPAIRERRARIEDALGAIGAAMREGVVPGGGISFLTAAVKLAEGSENNVAKAIIRNALASTSKELLHRDESAGWLTQQARRRERDLGSGDWYWWGWDASKGVPRKLNDRPQIIDTLTSLILSFKAAVSIASTLCLVEAAIYKKAKRCPKKRTKRKPHQ